MSESEIAKARMTASQNGNHYAKEVMGVLLAQPYPEDSMLSVVTSLLSAGYAAMETRGGRKLADEWMVLVLSSARAALKANNMDVTFNFIRRNAPVNP